MQIMSNNSESILPVMDPTYLTDGQPLMYKAIRHPDRKMFYSGVTGTVHMDAGFFYAPYIPGQPQEPYVWDHRARSNARTAIQQAIMDVIYFYPMLPHSIKPDMIHTSYNNG